MYVIITSRAVFTQSPRLAESKKLDYSKRCKQQSWTYDSSSFRERERKHLLGLVFVSATENAGLENTGQSHIKRQWTVAVSGKI